MKLYKYNIILLKLTLHFDIIINITIGVLLILKCFESIEIGDKLFIMQNPVIIVNKYPCFHLVKVSYIDNDKLFYADISALSQSPKFEISISIY